MSYAKVHEVVCNDQFGVGTGYLIMVCHEGLERHDHGISGVLSNFIRTHPPELICLDAADEVVPELRELQEHFAIFLDEPIGINELIHRPDLLAPNWGRT